MASRRSPWGGVNRLEQTNIETILCIGGNNNNNNSIIIYEEKKREKKKKKKLGDNKISLFSFLFLQYFDGWKRTTETGEKGERELESGGAITFNRASCCLQMARYSSFFLSFFLSP
jgi:hypothetical protein